MMVKKTTEKRRKCAKIGRQGRVLELVKTSRERLLRAPGHGKIVSKRSYPENSTMKKVER
jgi:hypothetical protein